MFEPSLRQAKRPSAPPRTDLAQLLNTLDEHLRNGEPVEYLARDLTARGLDREVALQMINAKLTSGRKTCNSCSLTYAANVESCASCGQQL
jgi:hypothetical protein